VTSTRAEFYYFIQDLIMRIQEESIVTARRASRIHCVAQEHPAVTSSPTALPTADVQGFEVSQNGLIALSKNKETMSTLIRALWV